MSSVRMFKSCAIVVPVQLIPDGDASSCLACNHVVLSASHVAQAESRSASVVASVVQRDTITSLAPTVSPAAVVAVTTPRTAPVGAPVGVAGVCALTFVGCKAVVSMIPATQASAASTLCERVLRVIDSVVADMRGHPRS